MAGLLLASPLLRAAELVASDDYVVQVWDTDSGLPHSSVTSLAQTPDGYLWVGTRHGGLARFDGDHFVTFNPVNTPEFKSIEIQKLLVDAAGTLWVGTVEGRLISYRAGKFNFEFENTQTPASWLYGIISQPNGGFLFSSQYGWLFCDQIVNGTNRWQTIQPPHENTAANVVEDSDGAIWYRTDTLRLAQLRGTNVTRLENPPGLRSPRINVLMKTADGQICVGTEKEIAVWTGSTFADQTPTNGESNVAVRQMITGKGGALWVLTDDKLSKCVDRQWVWEVPSTSSNLWHSLAGLNMFSDARGGVWLTHTREGLWHVDRDGHISRIGEKQGLPTEMVECWLEDREGNIWVGLTDGGLACVRPRIFHTVWPTDKLSKISAHSVCETPDGTLWFGTGGQDILRWQAGEFKRFTLPAQPQSGVEITVLPAGTNEVWVGTVQNGLLRLTPDGFKTPFPSKSIGTVARCLFQDHAGALWIGSEFGLFRWADGKLKRFTAADGFSAAYVLALAEDSAGALWIGTANGELRRYQAGKFTSFWPADSASGTNAPAGKPDVDPMLEHGRGTLTGGERFWALHFDADGVLWIGTLGGGLLRFEHNHFTRITVDDGLPNENVSQILEDARGQFWLGTRRGIVRAAKKDLDDFARGLNAHVSFITYGKYDGLPALECSGGNQPNCWKNPDGQLWFTTIKGAVWVDPSVLRVNRLPPPVQVEEVLLDGARLTENNSPAPAWRPPATLRIPAGRHYFEFKFSALSFTAPDKVQFKWRLQGLEKDWVDGGDRHAVSYSFIPPGEYQFQIRACNNDGVWSDPSAPIRLTVLPYFWQTWWFRIAVVLALGAVVVLIYLSRIARLRELEKLRLRIARDLHDEVGANLGCISILAQMMEQTPSAADAVRVWTIASQTIETLREIIWFIDPTHDRLSDLVARLHETARMMLLPESFTFTQTGDFKSVELSLTFRRNVLPLFKETLHNVLKHAHATAVTIAVRRSEKEFSITIQDNGRGFDRNRKSSGNGMPNLQRRATELRGQIEIKSSPGGGTTVTLTAPLTQTRGW